MANTYTDIPVASTSDARSFPFTFPYLSENHIKVEIDGIATTEFTVVTSPTTKVYLNSATAGTTVRVKRVSILEDPIEIVDFEDSSVLTAADMDTAYLHSLYSAQENYERVAESIQFAVGDSSAWDMLGKRITNLASPINSLDGVNKSYVTAQIDALTLDISSAGPSVSTHTGDNTTTDFTLSFTSNHSIASAFDVAVNGLVQIPDVDYTIIGASNQISFTSAPATSANIVVIERGYKQAITEIPTTYDYGSVVGASDSSYSYGFI